MNADIKSTLLVLMLGLVLGIFIGNWDGDRTTLRDCSTKGKTKLVGNVEITCNVAKDL